MTINVVGDERYKAANFSLPSYTAWLHDVNYLRPVTQLQIIGPESKEYILGLFIVPLVLIASLVLWSLLVCCIVGWNSYKRRRRRSNQGGGLVNQYSVRTKNCLWIGFIIMLFASLISWMVALGFAFQFASFGDDVQRIATLVGNSNDHLRVINESCTNLIQETIELPVDCDSLPEEDQTQLDLIISNLTTTVIFVQQGLDDILAITEPSEASLEVVSDSLGYVLAIRTGVVIALTLSQCILVLVLLFITIARFRGSSYGRCLKAGCCCDQCCTPLIGLVITNLILAVVLSAFIHAIVLLFADACTPNVNVNVNRVVGQALNYTEFIEYNGSSTAEMCNLTLSDSVPPPPEISFLCFYQTCDLEQDYAERVIVAIEEIVADLTALVVDIRPFIENITQSRQPSSSSFLLKSSSNISTACGQDLLQVLGNATNATVNALAVFINLDCRTINTIYAAAVYVDLCANQVYNGLSKFQAVICGNVFFMCAFLVWLYFEEVFMEKEERSRLQSPCSKICCCGCWFSRPPAPPEAEPAYPIGSFDLSKTSFAGRPLVGGGSTQTSTPSSSSMQNLHQQQQNREGNLNGVEAANGTTTALILV